jgi:polyhydroxyalkanoate synthesis regulator phasin
MPAPKSSSSGSRATSRAKSPATSARKRTATKASARSQPTRPTSTQAKAAAGVGDTLATFTEQLFNRILRPLDMVLLTRERIQETLDEAAERGRVTRSDANDLVAELVRRGRQQTDDIFKDIEQLVDRGREQLESATRRGRIGDPLDRLVRSVTPSGGLPIEGYDDLTAGQVSERLKDLSPAELRKVRDYERRHANRKSVLAAIDKQLA